jgi:hypothetical protein
VEGGFIGEHPGRVVLAHLIVALGNPNDLTIKALPIHIPCIVLAHSELKLMLVLQEARLVFIDMKPSPYKINCLTGSLTLEEVLPA